MKEDDSSLHLPVFSQFTFSCCLPISFSYPPLVSKYMLKHIINIIIIVILMIIGKSCI